MLSPELILVGIVLAVVFGVLLLYAVVAAFLPERAPEPKEQSLAERAEEFLPPRNFFGETDRAFARTVRDAHLGLTTEAAILWMLLVGAIVATLSFALSADWMPTVTGFLVGMALTYLYFIICQDRRRRAVQEQLPDGCFQLARSLRAGLALPGALQQSAEFTPAPLGGIFESTGKNIALGLSAPAVLNRAAAEIRLTDFDQFAAAVALNAETGGDLPTLLERLGTNIRERNHYRGFFRSVTALARLSAMFIAAAAPIAALIYFWFHPDLFMPFATSAFGITMIAVAVVLEILGLLWIFWLLRRREDY
ncbi:MAG: type II secretion system F family protein [Gemmataceae bacterium]|nr:type II secretion system F family protein [Gemmataceae bacterium]